MGSQCASLHTYKTKHHKLKITAYVSYPNSVVITNAFNIQRTEICDSTDKMIARVTYIACLTKKRYTVN